MAFALIVQARARHAPATIAIHGAQAVMAIKESTANEPSATSVLAVRS